MKYCENCGAELQEGVKFCEACGAPIEGTSQEEHAPPEGTATEDRPVQEGLKAKQKKIILIVVIAVVVVLAIAAIVLWQTGIFAPKAEPASTQAVQTVDQNNLYGTLDWQENQDKTYETKNSLIEGNSDVNLKEIFEESAYFTPKDFKYATDGETEYHLVNCTYKKDGKKVPYAMVFRVNKDKHLELAELQKNDMKVEQEDFDGFLKKLYDVSSMPDDFEKYLIGKKFFYKDTISSGSDYIQVKSIDENSLVIYISPSSEDPGGDVKYDRYKEEPGDGVHTFNYYRKDVMEDEGMLIKTSIQKETSEAGYKIIDSFYLDGKCEEEDVYYREGSANYNKLYDAQSYESTIEYSDEVEYGTCPPGGAYLGD